MKGMIEHKIKASPAQIKKLMSGGAVTFKPMQFDPSSRTMLMVRPNTNRRIQTALRKQKGIRLMLKPDEDVMEENEGGKVSLKSIGKTLKKTFASPKAIKTYKEIGKEVLPIAKGIADAGVQQGSMALATYLGQPELAPLISGTAQRGLDVGYRKLGDQVGLDPDTPVPYIDSPERLQAAASMSAEKNVQKRLKGRQRQAAMKALEGDYRGAQELAADVAIDKNLTGVEKKIAQKAARGEYSDVKQMATDYAAEKLAQAAQIAPAVAQDDSGLDEYEALMRGRGIRVSKTRAGYKVGGASGKAYERAMMMGGRLSGGMQSASGRQILPMNPPSNVIQLGSPYQRINSPAMSPFIAKPIQLDNRPVGISSNMGGSFMPAGARSGRGFMPSG
jgi:hypothetical protein